MLVTVIILAVALIPTGDFWWLTDVFLVSELGNIKGGDFQVNFIGVPAIYYFKKLDPSNSQGPFVTSRNQAPFMVISLLMLFLVYFIRPVKLSSRATTRLWLRTKPGIVIRKVLGAVSRRSAPSRASFYWKVQSMIR